jgi:hypothetical protein
MQVRPYRAVQLHLFGFGIPSARHRWAEKKDIINARPVKESLKMLK